MNFYQFVTRRDTKNSMKKVLSRLLYKAYNGLKDLTDPARQGSPYDRDATYETSSSKRELHILKKRMNWRI
jgi:hypothetical protein